VDKPHKIGLGMNALDNKGNLIARFLPKEVWAYVEKTYGRSPSY